MPVHLDLDDVLDAHPVGSAGLGAQPVDDFVPHLLDGSSRGPDVAGGKDRDPSVGPHGLGRVELRLVQDRDLDHVVRAQRERGRIRLQILDGRGRSEGAAGFRSSSPESPPWPGAPARRRCSCQDCSRRGRLPRETARASARDAETLALGLSRASGVRPRLHGVRRSHEPDPPIQRCFARPAEATPPSTMRPAIAPSATPLTPRPGRGPRWRSWPMRRLVTAGARLCKPARGGRQEVFRGVGLRASRAVTRSVAAFSRRPLDIDRNVIHQTNQSGTRRPA